MMQTARSTLVSLVVNLSIFMSIALTVSHTAIAPNVEKTPLSFSWASTPPHVAPPATPKIEKPIEAKKAPVKVKPEQKIPVVAEKSIPEKSVEPQKTAVSQKAEKSVVEALPEKAKETGIVADAPVMEKAPAKKRVFLRRVVPLYPPLARRMGKEGTVILEVWIDKEGVVKKAEIVKKAGFGFDEEAVEAVMKSTFTRSPKGAKEGLSKVRIPYEFRLK